MSDDDLLARYLHEGSQTAFAELVDRHLDLVYSVARRLLPSPDLAKDVTQSVFVDLARHAARIRRGTPLVAWLHVVARRTAIDAIRQDARRRARETASAASADSNPTAHPAMDSDDTAWTALAPLLDEAVESLDERDRTAVLLRYFENKSLREIGAALGTTDDAAQKRLARAVDRLRAFFVRRGIVVTAAGLTTGLSAHAIESAPVALAASIAASAPAAVATTLAPGSSSLVMTTAQKLVASTLLALALGTAFYGVHVIRAQRAEIESLRHELADSLRQLGTQRTEADAKLAAALKDLAAERARTAAFASADPEMEAALDSWLQRVVLLRHRLAGMPELQIPELRLLTSRDWLDATKETKLDTEWDVRRALSGLRQSAKEHFSAQLFPALRHYLEANGGQPPADPAQIAPYFEQPVDPAIVARYRIWHTGEPGADLPWITGEDGQPVTWLVSEKAPVDDYYDTSIFVSAAATGQAGSVGKFEKEVNAAMRAFQAAHPQVRPTDPAQLQPYLKSAIDPAYVQARLDQRL